MTMGTKGPEPDVMLGTCADCSCRTRVYELMSGHWICLSCYRDLVSAVLVTAREKEGEDAAS